ncbi:MAG TPA: type I methionyl aminopeptidase [Myxococcota bacterium]|jgi:methionyl aminopeptidase|nr:type I methionyl aminopeptidase [Myxococcota bacterium]
MVFERVHLKSTDEIRLMREANLIVAEVLDALEKVIAPGVSTQDLDDVAVRILKERGAKSAFLGYRGYPRSLCTSVNEEVVHGIPRKDKVLREGDIVGVDFGAVVSGFVGDAARTVAVGKVSPEAQRLMDVTRQSLERAIAQCVVGNRIIDVARAVQEHAEAHGYTVVRDFVGHGIGRRMHENPYVPNFVDPAGQFTKALRTRLQPGLVIAIEPMVNAGGPEVVTLDDEWTAVTVDGKLSAHFEHSIAITEEGPFVLSRRDGKPEAIAASA